MTTIYCDMSADDSQKVCAWGCIIVDKGIEHIYSDHGLMDKTAMPSGELYAIIQSLEKLSSFDARNVEIYTDFRTIVVDFKALKRNTMRKLKGNYAQLFNLLSEYLLRYNLKIKKISGKENPAHKIAYSELKKALQNPENIKEAAIPKVPHFEPRKQENEFKKPQTIIKMSLSQYTNTDTFNSYLIRTLEKCCEDDTFHTALLNKGINISSLYQIMKNKFPKPISYKQNGEKKMHISFSKALYNSKFCVCEIKGLFFVFYNHSVPETANILKYFE